MLQNAGRGQEAGPGPPGKSLPCKSLSYCAACWLQIQGTP